ncbi:hypothetical protein AOLI_G00295820 [Acnodon oligacanthus]
MPLKTDGDPGYGSMVGPGLSLSGSLGGSETLPLLIPEAVTDKNTWKPMNREQLEAVAGGPGWRKFRSRLVLLFWLGWLTMLGTAIVVVVQSPRPVATPLHWWQKELFYRLQPALFLDVGHTEFSAISKVSDRLAYLRFLGVGVMILEGLFRHDVSPPNLTEIDQRLGTLPQFHQLIIDSHKAGVRIILDLCNLDLLNGPEFCNKTEMLSDSAVHVQTLTEWRALVEEFSTEYNERIVMVKQTGDSSSPLNASRLTVNSSLVDLVSKSLLPSSFHQLSAAELAEAMESRLKTLQGERPSWTVDRPVAWELQKVLMVLIMTLPGTPIIRYGDEISQSVNVSVYLPIDGQAHEDTIQQNRIKSRRSTSFFQSLSRTHFREEALLFGTFTFLPFNSSAQSNSSATPPLAFLRSWGCVHVLVLFNLGSEPQSLDPNWAPSLPEEGVFVTSTGLDRLGAVSLKSIQLQPHEAIVIKLFEPDNYF